jgi:hypothetical protein
MRYVIINVINNYIMLYENDKIKSKSLYRIRLSGISKRGHPFILLKRILGHSVWRTYPLNPN